MAWFEKDRNNTLYSIEPGTKRSFISKFHNPGQPQIKVDFLDDHTAKIFVPDICVMTETTQMVERIIERQNFSIKYQRGEQEEVFYEVIYRPESIAEAGRRIINRHQKSLSLLEGHDLTNRNI